jgi:hypothetical protein
MKFDELTSAEQRRVRQYYERKGREQRDAIEADPRIGWQMYGPAEDREALVEEYAGEEGRQRAILERDQERQAEVERLAMQRRLG